MPLQRDNDVVRGLGFVALYAAYLEEQVDNLLFILQSVVRNNRGRTTFVFIASRVKGYQGLSKSYIRADVISKNLTPLCV